MTIYRLVALLANPNTFSRINTQVYQTRGIVVAKFTLHVFSFLALATHKRGVSYRTGQGYPLQKAQKGGYRRLPVRGCFRSNALRLLLLVLSCGCASALLSP
jgi:hypothetical protein